MIQTAERVLVWIALVAVVLAVIALGLTFLPGGPALLARITAGAQATATPSIDDAQSALDAGDVATAKRIAAQVVAANPKDASVDNHAGNIAERAGDDTAAARDYQAGEAADAHDPWNFVALGELQARQGRYTQADAQLRAALTVAPTAQFLHYDLGVVELHEHLADAALADFTAELKRSPGYRPALDGRVQALAALGRPVELRAARLALAHAGGAPSSPSPRAAPASPSPSPAASPSPTVAPTPSALPIAQVVIASPSPAATPSPRPSPTRTHRAVAAATPPPPSPSPSISPVPLPRSVADIANDAKWYLFQVAADPNFGRALPFADTRESIAQIKSAMNSGTIDDILSSGTAAMLMHHFALAESVFEAASSRAPGDWRGPYLAGINAQQRGDQDSAKGFFEQAAARGGPAAAYIGLAIADVAQGDDGDAFVSAQHAVDLSPTAGNALFTAGAVDLLVANVPAAEHDLTAAASSSDAPGRSSEFLSRLRAREGLPPP